MPPVLLAGAPFERQLKAPSFRSVTTADGGASLTPPVIAGKMTALYTDATPLLAAAGL